MAILSGLSLSVCLVGCSTSGGIDAPEDLPPEEAQQSTVEPPSFPDTGINTAGLTVTGIEPDSGPFVGGNQAIVRGSGFTDDALVFIGGRMVQPAETTLRDGNSLLVIVPAGEAGLADVSVSVGSEEAARAGAYTYNPLVLEPTSGSIAGGTLVTITLDGGLFDDGAEVVFGDEPCTDPRVVTPNTLRCLTPRGDVGDVDVIVRWPMDAQAQDVAGSTEPTHPTIEALDAFEYIDLTDTDRGGLNGGPIEGTLNITVIDTFANLAIANALVVIGDDPNGPLQGRTDSRGQITFSGDDVQGPLTVHVAGDCLEKLSIVGFDAENATLHVTPSLDPSCAMPGDPPPPGRGTAGALISGELIFPGSDEFAINAWDNLPRPRSNEQRVSYVFTTRSRVGAPNPSPGLGNLPDRVVEETSERGKRGYPYRIFARPAGLAVYAISGLERRDTGEFTPYVMGVTRDIVTAPGEESTDVDIMMDIPLDREVAVQLLTLPPPGPRGPDRFSVQAHVDLGGEGVIYRQVNGQTLDVLTAFSAGAPFRFFAQPALVGNLIDGRYRVNAGWYTGDPRELRYPLTEVWLEGVAQQPTPVEIGDLLAIPVQRAPLEGAPLPEDRVLRWEMEGTQPDFWVVSILGGDSAPAWTQIVAGTQSQSAIPDLSGAEDVKDIAPGVITWAVQAIRVQDFVFDQFKFNLIESSRYWSHTSADAFISQL